MIDIKRNYFGLDFSDCCPDLYWRELKHISAAVSSELPLVSFVYLGKEMIQPRKSFLKFDYLSNKAFKKGFPRLNHFYTQINKEHLRKAERYSG